MIKGIDGKFARSLFVVRDMAKNEEFTENNFRSIRASNGLHPQYINTVIGRISGKYIEKGTH